MKTEKVVPDCLLKATVQAGEGVWKAQSAERVNLREQKAKPGVGVLANYGKTRK